jgi:transcription-repair coupling factor (superfamily II helicase)
LPIGLGTKPTEIAETQSSAGQECLVIEYAPNEPSQPAPKLYVPVTEAHLVSKYVGTGKARPPLNTLGGTRWAKAKAQAERAVRDVASELLSIQAARDSQPGHSFAPDAPWQREFEGSFIYEETPDQLKAIGETKTDMERAKPMDRLICGDVGFGKTEVGIRAAFKAVMDGKQVAVLVPTTVLAQQHYNTFRERMADYPVRVELLSRFRTRRVTASRKRTLCRQRGYCHRHAPSSRVTLLSRILTGCYRRRTALWRASQGKVQNAAQTRRCSDVSATRFRERCISRSPAPAT